MRDFDFRQMNTKIMIGFGMEFVVFILAGALLHGVIGAFIGMFIAMLSFLFYLIYKNEKDKQINKEQMVYYTSQSQEVKENDAYYQKNWEQRLKRQEQELNKEEKKDYLKLALEQWEEEKYSPEGAMCYLRIKNNWNQYAQLSRQRNADNPIHSCGLCVLEYLLQENAPIRKEQEIVDALSGEWDEDAIRAAIDSLLIQRSIIIAVEGSLDYYRINLRWNIALEIERIERRAKIEQQKREQEMLLQQAYRKQNEQNLDKMTVDQLETQSLMDRMSAYNVEIAQELISCLENNNRSMTLYEIQSFDSILQEINQLKLLEIINTLILDGSIERIEENRAIKYQLVNRG